LNDKNGTESREKYAQEIIDSFVRNNILSEFNTATYTGVSLCALTFWAAYMPDSILNKYGKIMNEETWNMVGETWHPQLKDIAGPSDRTYGWDMN
jgi:hypothetical protein